MHSYCVEVVFYEMRRRVHEVVTASALQDALMAIACDFLPFSKYCLVCERTRQTSFLAMQDRCIEIWLLSLVLLTLYIARIVLRLDSLANFHCLSILRFFHIYESLLRQVRLKISIRFHFLLA